MSQWNKYYGGVEVKDWTNDKNLNERNNNAQYFFVTIIFLYWVSQKKLLHKSEGKSTPKKENDLAKNWKFGTWLVAL